MSYRRSLTTTAALLRRRFHPSFSHVIRRDHDNDDTKPCSPMPTVCRSSIGNGILVRGFGNVGMGNSSSVTRSFGYGVSFHRYMSSTVGDGSGDEIADMGYVAEVIAEDPVGAVASQVPAVNEVAIAAADSFFPVAGLQYVIDGVHSFTGLNWWASIALTTILIRSATIPVLINQLKATTKLNMLRPRLEELRSQMQTTAMDPDAMAKGQQRMQELFKQYGVTPFTPLKGLLIQGPVFICFFLAIRNMTEKVPSFKSGGAYWFVDLTTPDSLLILPVLTALTFWITVECNMQEGLEGNPIAGTMKKFSRVLALIGVPVMMSFPKALFCYWLTSNFFSLTYGFAIRRPEVKELLGLTEMTVSSAPSPSPAPAPARQPDIATDAACKSETVKPEPASSTDSMKATHRKISSASVLSQRIRSLERKVKGTKNKK